MQIVELIPVATGAMIFISVILAGRRTVQTRRLAFVLGGISQLLLFTFGGLTGHWTFSSHLVVFFAFAFNVADSYWSIGDKIGRYVLMLGRFLHSYRRWKTHHHI